MCALFSTIFYAKTELQDIMFAGCVDDRFCRGSWALLLQLSRCQSLIIEVKPGALSNHSISRATNMDLLGWNQWSAATAASVPKSHQIHRISPRPILPIRLGPPSQSQSRKGTTSRYAHIPSTARSLAQCATPSNQFVCSWRVDSYHLRSVHHPKNIQFSFSR